MIDVATLAEGCGCGASVSMDYPTGSAQYEAIQRAEAFKYVETWRRDHHHLAGAEDVANLVGDLKHTTVALQNDLQTLFSRAFPMEADMARAVAAFKQAWATADTAGDAGHRTEQGLYAALFALSHPPVLESA